MRVGLSNHGVKLEFHMYRNDLAFDVAGYVFVLINDFTTAASGKSICRRLVASGTVITLICEALT